MKQRPLSPHLDIYKFSLLMASSILHRITGVSLALGSVLLILWLLALGYDKSVYEAYTACATSPLALLIWIPYSWAAFQHLAGGIRHFIWDTGRGFEVDKAKSMAKFGLIFSVVATVVFWVIVIPKAGFF